MFRKPRKDRTLERTFKAASSSHRHAVYVSRNNKNNRLKYAALVLLSVSVAAAVAFAPSSDTINTPITTNEKASKKSIKIISSETFGAIDFSSEEGYSDKPYVPEDPIDQLDLIAVGPIEAIVDDGDTFYKIGRRNGLSANQIGNIVENDAANKMLKTLRKGDSIEFILGPLGNVERVLYEPSAEQSLAVLINDDGDVTVNHTLHELDKRIIAASTTLRDASIHVAGQQAGLSSRVISNLARVFRYDIDFNRQVSKGDSFAVVYEGYFDKSGIMVRSGRILAAQYNNNGKSHDAVLFERSDGDEYYSLDGRRLKKSFMRNPVDSVRITSRFSKARKHPVLHRIRAHKGVDYGARRGTKIFATASGTIIYKSRQRGYGNVIKIKHANGYVSLYAHMDRFAKVRKGQKVQQGKLIGYVGSTGMVTGPHLHYEVTKNGKHIDPLSIKSVGSNRLSKKELATLKANTKSVRKQLAQALATPSVAAK